MIANRIAINPSLEQMFPSDKNLYLRQLSDSWRRLPKRPHVACAYEKAPTAGVMIVPWTTATRHCDGTPTAIESSDHISIVKPDRPDHASVVLLVNMLNLHVIGKEFSARLELPDFLKEGTHALFKMDGRQRRARVRNAGQAPIQYSIDEVNDPSLYIVPEAPEVPPQSVSGMMFSLLLGAEAAEYQFVIRTNIPSEQSVVVKVATREALAKAKSSRFETLVEGIRHYVESEKSTLVKRQPDDPQPLQRILQIAHETASAPPLAEGSRWVLTADLLATANWAHLAASAMRQAEKVDPAIVSSKSVRYLAGIVTHQFSGTPALSSIPMQSASMPPAQMSTTRNWTSDRQLELTRTVASKLEEIPALRPLGLSLSADVSWFNGERHAALEALSEAATLKAASWINPRFRALSSVPNSPGCYIVCVGETPCELETSWGYILDLGPRVRYTKMCQELIVRRGTTEGVIENAELEVFRESVSGKPIIRKIPAQPLDDSDLKCLYSYRPCGRISSSVGYKLRDSTRHREIFDSLGTPRKGLESFRPGAYFFDKPPSTERTPPDFLVLSTEEELQYGLDVRESEAMLISRDLSNIRAQLRNRLFWQLSDVRTRR